MPFRAVDYQWTPSVYYHHSDGDKIILAVSALRLAELSLELGLSAAKKLSLQKSMDFFPAEQIANDFFTFAAFLAKMPLVIPKDTYLPKFDWMNSPLVEPSYYHVEADYFLYWIEQKPLLKIETGLDIFPPKLWAQLVISAKVVYKKTRGFRLPPVPYDYEKHTQEGWTVYHPHSSLWGDVELMAFQRSTIPNQWYNYSLYPRFAWLWQGVEIEPDMMQYSALYKHSMRIDSEGEIYYWGSDDPDIIANYPYKSIEPIPQERFGLDVTEASWAIHGGFHGLGVPSGAPSYYSPPGLEEEPPEEEPPPPESEEPPKKPQSVLSMVKNLKYSYGVPGSGLIDGSWRVGFGGVKIK